MASPRPTLGLPGARALRALLALLACGLEAGAERLSNIDGGMKGQPGLEASEGDEELADIFGPPALGGAPSTALLDLGSGVSGAVDPTILGLPALGFLLASYAYEFVQTSEQGRQQLAAFHDSARRFMCETKLRFLASAGVLSVQADIVARLTGGASGTQELLRSLVAEANEQLKDCLDPKQVPFARTVEAMRARLLRNQVSHFEGHGQAVSQKPQGIKVLDELEHSPLFGAATDILHSFTALEMAGDAVAVEIGGSNTLAMGDLVSYILTMGLSVIRSGLAYVVHNKYQGQALQELDLVCQEALQVADSMAAVADGGAQVVGVFRASLGLGTKRPEPRPWKEQEHAWLVDAFFGRPLRGGPTKDQSRAARVLAAFLRDPAADPQRVSLALSSSGPLELLEAVLHIIERKPAVAYERFEGSLDSLGCDQLTVSSQQRWERAWRSARAARGTEENGARQLPGRLEHGLFGQLALAALFGTGGPVLEIGDWMKQGAGLLVPSRLLLGPPGAWAAACEALSLEYARHRQGTDGFAGERGEALRERCLAFLGRLELAVVEVGAGLTLPYTDSLREALAEKASAHAELLAKAAAGLFGPEGAAEEAWVQAAEGVPYRPEAVAFLYAEWLSELSGEFAWYHSVLDMVANASPKDLASPADLVTAYHARL